MRQYRVFDNVEKKYLDKDLFLDQDGKLYLKCKIYTALYVTTRDWTAVEPADPERYTVERGIGLKDKNGVEIFEGDVIKVTNSENQIQIAELVCSVMIEFFSYVARVNKVNIWNGYKTLKPETGKTIGFSVISAGKIIEVTGTIHDKEV